MNMKTCLRKYIKKFEFDSGNENSSETEIYRKIWYPKAFEC